MSERMTNLEIEDVLSSIRRLVAQEPRPAVTQTPNPVPRLVLTPALRVPAPEPAPPEPDEPLRLDARVQEIESLLSRAATEFEPDLAEDIGVPAQQGWTQSDEAPFIDADEVPPVEQLSPLVEPMPHVAGTTDAPSGAAPEVMVFDESVEDDCAVDHQTEPATLDETVLREIVRDVLREELAGPMGARVTRNLRRLIRAEVARALAAPPNG